MCNDASPEIPDSRAHSPEVSVPKALELRLEVVKTCSERSRLALFALLALALLMAFAMWNAYLAWDKSFVESEDWPLRCATGSGNSSAVTGSVPSNSRPLTPKSNQKNVADNKAPTAGAHVDRKYLTNPDAPSTVDLVYGRMTMPVPVPTQQERALQDRGPTSVAEDGGAPVVFGSMLAKRKKLSEEGASIPLEACEPGRVVAREEVIKEWVRSTIVVVPILGIRLSANDVPQLGAIALVVGSLWLLACLRRETEVMASLSEYARDSHLNAEHRELVRTSVVGNSLFLRIPATPVRRCQHGCEKQWTRKSYPEWLFFLFVFLPLFILIGAIAQDYWTSHHFSNSPYRTRFVPHVPVDGVSEKLAYMLDRFLTLEAAMACVLMVTTLLCWLAQRSSSDHLEKVCISGPKNGDG